MNTEIDVVLAPGARADFDASIANVVKIGPRFLFFDFSRVTLHQPASPDDPLEPGEELVNIPNALRERVSQIVVGDDEADESELLELSMESSMGSLEASTEGETSESSEAGDGAGAAAGSGVGLRLINMEPLLLSFSMFRNRDYWGPVPLYAVLDSPIGETFTKAVAAGDVIVFYLTCTGFWVNLERARGLTNAVTAAGALAMLADGSLEPTHMVDAFDPVADRLEQFKDASSFRCCYPVSVNDTLVAVGKALDYGLVPQSWLTVGSGHHPHPRHVTEPEAVVDYNWIIEGKLIGFAGPSMTASTPSAPADFLPLFKRLGVTTIVRLNGDPKTYDESEFTAAGLSHLDLCFKDGSVPSADIMEAWLNAVDSAPGVVGLHCRMGVGRTGTLAAAYLMFRYRFTARAAIAYTRVMRAGSIVGIQSLYLDKLEPALFDASTIAFKTSELNDMSPICSPRSSSPDGPDASDAAPPTADTDLSSSFPPIIIRADEARALNPRPHTPITLITSPLKTAMALSSVSLNVTISRKESHRWSRKNNRIGMIYLLHSRIGRAALFISLLNAYDAIVADKPSYVSKRPSSLLPILIDILNANVDLSNTAVDA